MTAKDLVLAIIGKIGTAGGTGYAIEFGGATMRSLSMEGRMTVCNMAIEAGARAGMVAVDDKTIEYLRGPSLCARRVRCGTRRSTYWKTLVSDAGAQFDEVVELDAAMLKPQVTWGTSPEMVVSVEDRVPDPDREKDPGKREAMERALTYMGLEPNTPITQINVDKIFIGSCTNCAHRGLARRGRRGARPAGGEEREARARRAGLRPREGAGRARRPRSHLQGRGLRVARRRAARCASA